MGQKKKTLPKDFEDLLSKGNLQKLKAVFDTCEPDARGGYDKQTALAFDECPHELAKWLVEQGADLQAADTYGNTPLHSRARSIYGNIKSLLELGADVNDDGSSIGTPLHAAADAHNPENTALLLAHGARIDVLNEEDYTPLEQGLISCDNIDIVGTVEVSRLLLDAGAEITPAMKERVAEIGKEFEFHRANFDSESVDEVSNALEELYKLFGVAPTAKRILHDGKSPITIKAMTWQKQHQELWELLVPSSGPAGTIQGEVIRISGRIANELEGNGGINWDNNYKKMADAFLTFVKEGAQLSSAELKEAEEIIKEVKRRSGDTERLCELGVKWVMGNPSPIRLPAVGYNR